MWPARRCRIEFAIREGKGIAALARHEPQLIPLPAEVGAVHDARAVRRPVGPRLPGRLLVTQLARRGAGARLHPPKSSGAVKMPAVRDENELLAVRRPRRRDVVIPLAVVIARYLAVVVVGEPQRILRPFGAQDEDVPP